MKIVRQRNLLTLASILAGGLPPTGWALTNPNFTPADLVKGCPTITEMQLCGDGKGGWIARDLKSVWAGSTPDVGSRHPLRVDRSGTRTRTVPLLKPLTRFELSDDGGRMSHT